ncbi:hypothetical protein [Foetidibacter luteolus]|uniref:hypothetical protein n=1 Tax=Foetidibacter luteolus TaxID=2608880 RepID=UPI00129AF1D1|nr:hypothetical protein [Foetidibacter luteolus]
MITAVAKGLEELLDEFVFVGGAVTELYAEDTLAAPEIRQTDDVDCIVVIATRKHYAELEEQLRAKEFANNQAMICRWDFHGITVDIMPTNEEILGFSNRWFSEGIMNSILYSIGNGQAIRILSAPYFISCKLEALFDRGLRDLRLSKDLEDIVFVLNYNLKLKDIVAQSNTGVKEFIRERFSILLGKTELREAVFCTLPFGENSPEYVERILAIMKLLTR